MISRTEAGCPEGTTIIVRDLFYNTPARMKFMKRDSVEGAAVFSCVQKQAVAHPALCVRFLRDGKDELSTPGDGRLISAIYSVFGRQTAMDMVEMDSSWEKTRVSGYISKPTASRGNRNYQIFFVNGRYVRSQVLSAALEEAYKNQMMVGRFPACVLSFSLPPTLVDVNIHPAKTEIKFLNERDAFDCVYYGALSALNKLSGKVDAKLPRQQTVTAQPKETIRQPEPFFRKMSTEEFRAVMTAPKVEPSPQLMQAVQHTVLTPVRQKPKPPPPEKGQETSVKEPAPAPIREPEQTALPLPKEESYRIIGECFRTYFLVEEGEALYLIDKHAAHERMLFDKLRAQNEPISPQALVSPISCQLTREEAAAVLEQQAILQQCGYTVEGFGGDSVLLREIPPELDPEEAQASLSQIAQCLLEGRRLEPEALHDELLHTIASKAAKKAGSRTAPAGRQALDRQVLEREDLKYCPHGRPICIRLTRGQLERQFGR